MAKGYRRFIRVDGRVIPSPRFATKRDADLWYKELKRQKDFGKHGIKVLSNDEMTFLQYSKTWIKGRMQGYPMATWASDEQRLRDYLLPEFGDLPLSRITSKLVRAVLKGITDSGKSIETRTRVKALASKILGDAFNEELIPFNPVHGIKFTDARKGKKRPEYLMTEAASEFIAAAKSLSVEHEFITMCGLFLGLRKSEIIPLMASDFNFKERMLTIHRKFEQASNTVKAGTKSGEDEIREVPIPVGVVSDLKRCISEMKHDGPYLLKGVERPYLPPRAFHDRINEIAKAAELKTSSHKLRHTFGREFVRNGGGIKALQAILGHSVSSTTDRYSNLDGRDIAGTSDTVSYGVRSEVES